MESLLDFGDLDNASMDSSCTSLSCAFLDELGPPPDLILSMPPPPLPPFMQHLISENMSTGRDGDGNCNFCHLFATKGEDSEFTLPNPSVTSTSSWLSITILSFIVALIIGIMVVLFLLKCRKGNFLRGHKSAPPVCSPADSCISPVVNEKSPQSIITSAAPSKNSMPPKYWRRGQELSDVRQRNFEGSEIDESYAACAESGSCTSSPVYAELDGGLVTHIPQVQLLGLQPSAVLVGPSVQAASPYSVGLHTYSEVTEAVRMAALGSSAALLPDSSYDNAAYLPTAAPDHYQTRSLRRGHRAATLAQLGSATPLLTNHLTAQTPGYLTSGRPSKKPRPLVQQIARGNFQRMQQDEGDSQLKPNHSRYGNRGQAMYNDMPIRQSPSLTTFKSAQPTYAYRESSKDKRPLPPVPGVRL